MKTIIIPTTQNIELEYPVAGLGERMLAGLLDFIVYIIYTILIVYLITTTPPNNESLGEYWYNQNAIFQIFTLPAAVFAVKKTNFAVGVPARMANKTVNVISQSVKPYSPYLFGRNLFSLISPYGLDLCDCFGRKTLVAIKGQYPVVFRFIYGEVFLLNMAQKLLQNYAISIFSGDFYRLITAITVNVDNLISNLNDTAQAVFNLFFFVKPDNTDRNRRIHIEANQLALKKRIGLTVLPEIRTS